MARQRWSMDELEILACALAEISSTNPANVHPTFLSLGGSAQRTQCALRNTIQAMMKARRFVLKRGTWRTWFALTDRQRSDQAKRCSRHYHGRILLLMNKATFRALDQVNMPSPRRPRTNGSPPTHDGSNVSADDSEREVENDDARMDSVDDSDQTSHEHDEAGSKTTGKSPAEQITAVGTSTMQDVLTSCRKLNNKRQRVKNEKVRLDAATAESKSDVIRQFRKQATDMRELSTAMNSQMENWL